MILERDCDLTPIVIAIMIGCHRLRQGLRQRRLSLQEGRGGVADLGRRPHEEDQHRLRGGEGQAVRDRRGVGAGWRLQWTGGGHCGDLLAAPRYVEKRLG